MYSPLLPLKKKKGGDKTSVHAPRFCLRGRGRLHTGYLYIVLSMSTSHVILKTVSRRLLCFIWIILSRMGIKTISFFRPQHPDWDQNLQFPPLTQHPASRACFRLHHFDALERDCLSRERSLLSMRCMLLWYGFKRMVQWAQLWPSVCQ